MTNIRARTREASPGSNAEAGRASMRIKVSGRIPAISGVSLAALLPHAGAEAADWGARLCWPLPPPMTVSPRPIPVVILGGSDLKPSKLPPSGEDHHPLAAYKGAAVRIDGRPIVQLLIERLRATGAFGPIWIVGPERIYGPLGVADEVIDSDADLGTNLKVAMDAFLARFRSGPLALLACDVLPDAEEWGRVLTQYREDADRSALWFPLARVPDDLEQLRAFAWKPEYRIVPEAGDEPVWILPSHLVIADPRALRLGLIYRVLQMAYRTRNRPIEKRRGPIARAVLLDLLWHDVLHLFSFRAPTLTWTVLSRGFRLARMLRAGTLTLAELERLTADVGLRSHFRRDSPGLGVRMPLVDALGLAEDVDTVEEAEDLAEHAEPRD